LCQRCDRLEEQRLVPFDQLLPVQPEGHRGTEGVDQMEIGFGKWGGIWSPVEVENAQLPIRGAKHSANGGVDFAPNGAFGRVLGRFGSIAEQE
jgi:hypothetical protein